METPIGPLFTDYYELTMAAAYFDRKITSDATFSLYSRDHKNRNYFVAAGLEFALDELSRLSFSEEDIAYLKETGRFKDDFLSFLHGFRFTGDVWAMPEGTIFFADEPVLEVTAPVIEAQIVETFLLNTIGFSSLIATKAARCVHAAAGRTLIDFSLRRTHGQDAGIKVARNTYIAGFSGTSNVLAGKMYGIPVSGTMAHSYVTAFKNEVEAFSAYAELFPDNSIFLIDTYDTLQGARNAVTVALEMEKRGHTLIGVRLDSGEMIPLSRKVRSILDEAGLPHVKIFASGDFDEFKIQKVISQGAEIDAFGVGTKVGVSADAPYFNVVYKMVRFRERYIRKFSPGKMTLAGEKQVFRKQDENGLLCGDIIGERGETFPGTQSLLAPVMKQGRILEPHPSLEAIRGQFYRQQTGLTDRYQAINQKCIYPVEVSRRLHTRQTEIPEG
jgi:nicotinate phosphoribosyltransferase